MNATEERFRPRADSPPELGGVAAPSIKWREATELGADGVVPLERLASNSFGTTPPARPFLEFDGLAGTPPNSGGEFQTRNCQLVTPSRVAATVRAVRFSSEHVLQRDLHNSRIADGQDPAERGVGQCHIRAYRVGPGRRAGIDMVWHVKRLRPKHDRLLLSNPERSRQAHIDLNTSRSQNVSRTESPVSSQCGLCERRWIEPEIDTLVWSVRRSKHLVRPLVGRPGQCIVEARGQCQVWARQDTDDSRNLPASTQGAQRSVGKLRRLIHCRHVEVVPPVQFAIPTIRPPALDNISTGDLLL